MYNQTTIHPSTNDTWPFPYLPSLMWCIRSIASPSPFPLTVRHGARLPPRSSFKKPVRG